MLTDSLKRMFRKGRFTVRTTMDQVLFIFKSSHVTIHPSPIVFSHCSLQLEQPRASALGDVRHECRLGDIRVKHNRVSDLCSSCCKPLALYVTKSTGRKYYA